MPHSLKLPEQFFPALPPALRFHALTFCPTAFPPFLCSRLPSPPLPVPPCAFHLSFSLSITPPRSHPLSSLLPLFLSSSYPISSLSFLFLVLPPGPSLQPGTVLLCKHQLPCFSSIAVNVSAALWRSPEPPNKGTFHFSSRMEGDRAAGPRGRQSGGSPGRIQPPGRGAGQKPVGRTALLELPGV